MTSVDPTSWRGLWRRFWNLFRSDVPTGEHRERGEWIALRPGERFIVFERPEPPPNVDVR